MTRYLEHQLKLQYLRIVVSIASYGSISAASRAIGLPQPTLTKSLDDLESVLGLQLFVRKQRGVEPTAAGKAVIDTARRVLAELSQLDKALEAYATRMQGHAAIGTLPAAAASLIPHVLAEFRHAEPDLSVEITKGESDLLSSACHAPPHLSGLSRAE